MDLMMMLRAQWTERPSINETEVRGQQDKLESGPIAIAVDDF
jgi:hypothetical protein